MLLSYSNSWHQLSQVQGLAWNRLQALDSALYAASQVTESMGGLGKLSTVNDQSEEQCKTPSPEFLSWMLKDIGTNRFGSYVQDYFRHVSKQTLESMGVSLLRKDASPADSILYTVCVNSVAYKFITTAMATCAEVPSDSTGCIEEDSTCGYTIFHTITGSDMWDLPFPRIGGHYFLLGVNKNCLQDLHRYWSYYRRYQNYAWKLGRSKCFLDVTPGGILHASARHVVPPLTNVRERLLPKQIYSQITPPSDSWKGLDSRGEIAALDYAYHSVMTTILHLVQLTPGQTLSAKDLYLDSARQELLALVSICLSSDKQSTVAFIHWTLLYYPLTAVFVLFCNAVVTSHTGDFNLLKTVADCLTQCGTISQNIVTLQKLFQEFVSLSQRFLNEESSTLFTHQDAIQASPSHQQEASSQNIIRNPRSPRWMNTTPIWSSGILRGLDEHPFDQTFPMLELSCGDPNFFLGSGPDI
ncbi:hypothetical protein BDV29DRAFT_191546 [Aspergillus leporis]|uniref:Uncharacterized protein n=1 Tax=Aspergillus leporis TaxID=41062 RepID=A0A5N5WYV4_9EURO|nr:hypothetical protein BDV29DRAFT_191546 [Aspergillus leporis]